MQSKILCVVEKIRNFQPIYRYISEMIGIQEKDKVTIKCWQQFV